MSKKRHGYWTKENCHKEALKYSTKTEFRNSSGGAYRKILKEKWDTDEFFKHMNRPIGRGIKWTKEKCHEEALKYKHKVDFKNAYGSAYRRAIVCGWLDEITSHMTTKVNRKRGSKYDLSFENCKKEALKHKHKIDFKKSSPTIYEHIRRNGWISKVCEHMILKNTKWTKERCHEEALKHKHKVDFKNANGSAYNRARVCGWLDEITSHMTAKVNKQKV